MLMREPSSSLSWDHESISIVIIIIIIIIITYSSWLQH